MCSPEDLAELPLHKIWQTSNSALLLGRRSRRLPSGCETPLCRSHRCSLSARGTVDAPGDFGEVGKRVEVAHHRAELGGAGEVNKIP